MEKVNGEISKAQGGHYITWDCPDTGKEMWCQGEFYYNKETYNYEHEVTDEDCNVIYKVVASI